MNEQSTIAPRARGLAFVTVRTLGAAMLMAAAQVMIASGACAAPTLTSLNPNEDYVIGGAKITVLGTGFSTTSGVKFGSTAGGFSVINDTEIEVTVPAHTAGTVDIVVTSSDGSTTKTADS
jgi:hypothetical protein